MDNTSTVPTREELLSELCNTYKIIIAWLENLIDATAFDFSRREERNNAKEYLTYNKMRLKALEELCQK